MQIDAYVKSLTLKALGSEVRKDAGQMPLESVLKGLAVQLWSDDRGESFWIVSDEEDVARLAEPRGTVYTASEIRRVVSISDPETVTEIHNWKRTMDARIAGYQKPGDV